MHEFCADDVVMEELACGQTEGLAAKLEREQAFVDSIEEFRGFTAPKVGSGGDCSSYEIAMEWISTNGSEIRIERVAAPGWRDGTIDHERLHDATSRDAGRHQRGDGGSGTRTRGPSRRGQARTPRIADRARRSGPETPAEDRPR